MFARPPFLFGGCQIDLFENTAFLFVARSTMRFVSAEELTACRLIDFELTACELPDINLNAQPAIDIALSAVLGVPEFDAVPGTECPVGARPVGDLDLRATAIVDAPLAAEALTDHAFDGLQIVDCPLAALQLPADVDFEAEVPDVDLDAEITNSEDCC